MFDAAFVISLSFRTDRFENFMRQVDQYVHTLPKIQRWQAIHGDTCRAPDFWTAGDGAWGCYRSHMNILEHCLNSGISSYIVFEDDAQIKPDFDERITRFFESLPVDWQQAYLGGQLIRPTIHPPIPVNEHVMRPFNVNRTHCFAVSRAGMLPIYRHISNLPFESREHIDHHLGRWHEHPETAVYCPSEWMVGQMGFSSNVSGKVEGVQFFDDPISYQVSHWLMKKPVCVYYRGSFSLLRECKAFLHPGNNIDYNGYDVTLAQAAKYVDPKPEIARWFNWVRTEVIRDKTGALPCFFHPKIPIETVKSALMCDVIEFSPKSVSEVEDFMKRISL